MADARQLEIPELIVRIGKELEAVAESIVALESRLGGILAQVPTPEPATPQASTGRTPIGVQLGDILGCCERLRAKIESLTQRVEV